LQTLPVGVLSIERIKALRFTADAAAAAGEAMIGLPLDLLERVALHVTQVVHVEAVVDVQQLHRMHQRRAAIEVGLQPGLVAVRVDLDSGGLGAARKGAQNARAAAADIGADDLSADAPVGGG
jgi:hypothetical protein